MFWAEGERTVDLRYSIGFLTKIAQSVKYLFLNVRISFPLRVYVPHYVHIGSGAHTASHHFLVPACFPRK
jgi:hypothetical protein